MQTAYCQTRTIGKLTEIGGQVIAGQICKNPAVIFSLPRLARTAAPSAPDRPDAESLHGSLERPSGIFPPVPAMAVPGSPEAAFPRTNCHIAIHQGFQIQRFR